MVSYRWQQFSETPAEVALDTFRAGKLLGEHFRVGPHHPTKKKGDEAKKRMKKKRKQKKIKKKRRIRKKRT